MSRAELRDYQTGIALTAAVLAATLAAYPHLPASVATHWNLHGHPDGYSPRWALCLPPAIMAVWMLLMWGLPRLAPGRFEAGSFRSAGARIMLIVVALLAYCDAIVLWIGLGHALNVPRWVMAALGLLFVFMGKLMTGIRRNFFIGVRTPWTLASERVWRATHRLAARTFPLAGVVALVFTAFQRYGWSVAALLAGALFPVAYSLYVYKRLERKGEL